MEHIANAASSLSEYGITSPAARIHNYLRHLITGQPKHLYIPIIVELGLDAFQMTPYYVYKNNLISRLSIYHYQLGEIIRVGGKIIQDVGAGTIKPVAGQEMRRLVGIRRNPPQGPTKALHGSMLAQLLQNHGLRQSHKGHRPMITRLQLGDQAETPSVAVRLRPPAQRIIRNIRDVRRLPHRVQGAFEPGGSKRGATASRRHIGILPPAKRIRRQQQLVV